MDGIFVGSVAGGFAEPLAAFRKSYESLLQEERNLRALAEERARSYALLVAELGRLLDAQEMDRRRRADPLFPGNMDQERWRSLLREMIGRLVSGQAAAGWAGNAAQATTLVPKNGDDQTSEVERLRTQVYQLTEALRVAQSTLPARQGYPTGGATKGPNPVGDAASGQLTAGSAEVAPGRTDSGENPPAKRARPCLPVEVPNLPLKAPGKYADLFRRPEDWQKKALALAILGLTGWSLRLALADAIADRGVATSAMSGSWKTIYNELESAGLWEQRTVEPGNGLTAHIQVVTLTELGRKVLRTVGIQPVASEWDRLIAEHGGEAQAKHAGLVVAFTYHARLRSFATEICPPVAPPAEPDVALVRGDERIYVEVEAGSGEPERLMQKWRNQAGLQGFVAFCSTAPETRKALAQDARHAIGKGMATDLATLINWAGAEDYASFWAEGWP
jgi:hypothetical protein